MKEQNSKRSISSLAPFILFVILTTCLLSVLLTGADLYQNITKRDQISFDQRTLVQYITTKIRQNDVLGQIIVSDFDSSSDSSLGNTLHIYETIDGRTFSTRIYYYDGYIYELFSEKGLDFSMSDGQPLLQVKDLSFSLSQDMLKIDIQYDEDQEEVLYIFLRSNEEVVDEK